MDDCNDAPDVEKRIMKTRVMMVAALAGVLALSACEKKAEAPKTTDTKGVTGALSDAAKKTTDAAAGAVDSAKKEVGKTVDAAKTEAGKAVDAVKKEGEKVVASLTDDVKKTVTGYIEQLGKTNSLLEGIKTPADATAKLPDITKAGGMLSGVTEGLSKLSPELHKLVKDNFGSQMQPLTAKFKEQVDRLSKDAGIGKILGDALKGFKLFE
jgi:uncharacterized phage infection (PIP) family protein YhgE